MFFDRKPAHPAPQEDLANLKIADARVGDTVSVSGAAEDFSDVDFNIDRADQYEAGSRHWVEFSGMWRDRRVTLEVHRDETTQVRGNFDGRKLTLDELGLSEDDLSQIDARQNQSDFFDYDGKFWLYRESREMGTFSQGSSSGRGFYGWVFQEQDGKRFMFIRKFASEPFSATVRVQIEPADITVFRGA